MNLIESYTHAVGKHLPAKQRPDIEAEIHSMIQDMLDERSQKAGRPVDDAMTNEALMELGNPEKLAASYLPARYLIGPRLFPTFILVLRIVFVVLATLGVVGLGLRIGTGDLAMRAVFDTIVDSLSGYIDVAFMVFGNIVFIFAILERTLPQSEFDDAGEEWTPAELTQEPDPDHVSTWEPVLTIVFTVAGLVILNFYPELIGIHFSQGDGWVAIPLMSEAFFRVLPLINISGALTILVHGMLFRQGRWLSTTRWLSLTQQVLSLGITFILLTGPSILAITPASLTGSPIPATVTDLLIRILDPISKVVLGLALLGGTVESIKTLIRIFAKPGQIKLPAPK
jgi:hypothetical protein